jgi:dipeptidyl aminopeptidase/acylaminoacyl peptidase
MTRWADREYFLGGQADGRVGLFSPDGKRFVILVRKGNLERNTNEYSVLLFRTGDVFRPLKPQLVLTMSSASNRDAIQGVKWLGDSETFLFLGENLSEKPAVYSFNLGTKRLKKVTSHSTPILAYDVSSDGKEIVYEAAAGRSVSPDDTERNGIVITTQHPADLFPCECDSHESVEGDELELFVQANGRASRIPSSDFVSNLKPISLSPTGRYAVVVTYVRDIPPLWSEYEDRLLRPYLVQKRRPGVRSNVTRYMLLDTSSHVLTPLLDAPISLFDNGFAWAGDGTSLVLSGVYLPLNVADPTERAIRQKKTFVVEIRLPSKEIIKITDHDLRVVRWDRATGKVLLASEEWRKNLPPEAYKKVDSTWTQIPVSQEDTQAGNPLDVTLEEDINTPPRVFVSDSRGLRKTLLFDLNPQFAKLEFGRVEAVRWKATDGHEAIGGLYLPPDYRQGRRYPLVIQTHGFQPNKFWIDGPWNSAFAAQPLAAEGMAVLQIGGSADSGEDAKYLNTPEEAPRQMAAYEGAIDYLDGRGLIERNHVGIVGFSRTVFYVEYTLTHSRYQFAAASLADGFDGGYMNYLLWPSADSVQVNGGPPVGSGISDWLKHSPGFNLDRVRTPIHLEYYGPGNVLGGWQWFSGLSLLGKPVDFIWLPEGTHLLVKPWERLTSQQGNVDWFSFWLKGTEDPDRRKRAQYKRWEGLRMENQSDGNRDVVSDR